MQLDTEFPHLTQVLAEYGETLRQRYKDKLILNNHPTMENTLVGTAEYQLTMEGRTFVVSLSLQDYWKWVENDTRPHFPPLDAIRRWVEVKPVLPRPGDGGRLPTRNQLAYLIGRKIARDGTKGTHELEQSKEELVDEFNMRIEAALVDDVTETWNDILKAFRER